MKPPVPPNLRKSLEGAERVAVLAVGSTLRGDDAAGLLAAEALQRLIDKRLLRVSVQVFVGDTAPENLTGEIKRFRPTHLIILDAADVGRPPGHVEILAPDVLVNNPSAFTHALPFGIMASYLRRFFPCEVIILGIQPATREFGKAPSPAVSEAAERLASALAEALSALP